MWRLSTDLMLVARFERAITAVIIKQPNNTALTHRTTGVVTPDHLKTAGLGRALLGWSERIFFVPYCFLLLPWNLLRAGLGCLLAGSSGRGRGGGRGGSAAASIFIDLLRLHPEGPAGAANTLGGGGPPQPTPQGQEDS
jgi:hypothetical protein